MAKTSAPFPASRATVVDVFKVIITSLLKFYLSINYIINLSLFKLLFEFWLSLLAKEFPGGKRILIVELNGITAYILGT
jgi:hypothetical protein